MRALVKEYNHKLHASGARTAPDSARTASEPWAKICSLENSIFGRVLKRLAHCKLSCASSTTEVCSGIARETQPQQCERAFCVPRSKTSRCTRSCTRKVASAVYSCDCKRCHQCRKRLEDTRAMSSPGRARSSGTEPLLKSALESRHANHPHVYHRCAMMYKVWAQGCLHAVAGRT